MMIRGFVLKNGCAITEDTSSKIIDEALKTIKKELPEEAQTYEGYRAILEMAKERLDELKLVI